MKDKMIDPKKWYCLKEIANNGLIPMFKNRKTIRNWIKAGKLTATVNGSGKGTRYKIKGEWIIEFIAKYEARDFHS